MTTNDQTIAQEILAIAKMSTFPLTTMILSIGTDRPKQTVQTQIKLVLKSTLTLQYHPNSRRAMLSADSFFELEKVTLYQTLYALRNFIFPKQRSGLRQKGRKYNYSHYSS